MRVIERETTETTIPVKRWSINVTGKSGDLSNAMDEANKVLDELDERAAPFKVRTWHTCNPPNPQGVFYDKFVEAADKDAPKRSPIMPAAPVTSENPKDAVGSTKAPMSAVPAGVLFEIGVAMLEGSLKYGRHNYRAADIRASVYYDALMRHIAAWWEGEDNDPDSGMSHITKALATLVVLRDCQMRSRVKDDRPPRLPAGWLADLNAKAAALVKKYPEPRPAITQLDAAKE